MHGLLANLIDNPILIRELRRRMRGKALVWGIITYLVIMGITTIAALVLNSPRPGAVADVAMLRSLQTTGLSVYVWITAVQVLLVLIVAPTITAGLTTGEKERQTFEFLRVTTITRWMYILGCFLSTAFYVALALLCAMPLLSFAFLYGGVSLDGVLKTFLYLLGGSCVLSAIGLYLSSVCEKTRTSQGIVVFMIFGLLFAGFMGLQIYRTAFAGAGGGGGIGPSIYLFNTAVPTWLAIFVGLMGLSGVFLLLAERKAFEPADVRALSHLQYGVLLVVYLGAGLGLLAGNAFTTELGELLFLACGLIVLVSGAVVFAAGRMEVGDEIWHIKRLIPVLRPVDQTVPFLVAVGYGWWWTFSHLDMLLPALKSPGWLPDTFAAIGVAMFAAICCLARLATARTGSRHRAGTLALAVAAAMLAIPAAATELLRLLLPGAHAFNREVGAFSPLALLLDALRNPVASASPVSGQAALVFYTAVAVVLAIWSEIEHWRRWRGFNYHYDMPKG